MRKKLSRSFKPVGRSGSATCIAISLKPACISVFNTVTAGSISYGGCASKSKRFRTRGHPFRSPRSKRNSVDSLPLNNSCGGANLGHVIGGRDRSGSADWRKAAQWNSYIRRKRSAERFFTLDVSIVCLKARGEDIGV
jgi:hypothetical protein